MRRFKSVTGHIYVGNVLSQVDDMIYMDHYSVWNDGDDYPCSTLERCGDGVHFTVEKELPL
jgi:hypothetical protein